MTPSFNRASIYQLVRQFGVTKSFSDAAEVLRDVEGIFSDIDGHEQHLWAAVRDSGFVDALITRLSKPDHDASKFASFIYNGLNALSPCILAASHSFLTDGQKEDLFTRIHPIYGASFTTATKLMKSVSKSMLSLVQSSTVQFCGHAFTGFNLDERLIDPIDKEDMLSVVFDVLFELDMRPPSSTRRFQVQCCDLELDAAIFKTFSPEKPEFTAVRDAVKRYGPNRIAHEYTSLASDPDMSPVDLPAMISLFHYKENVAICQAFATNGMFGSLIQSHWQQLKGSARPNDGSTQLVTVSTHLVDLHAHGGSHADSPIVITTAELLESHDLLPFTARVLVDYPPHKLKYRSGVTKCIDDIGRSISLAVRYGRSGMDGQWKSEWSYIMRSLLSLERCCPPEMPGSFEGSRFAVEQWKTLGRVTMLDDKVEAMRTQRSCSGIRCPLYLQDEVDMVQGDMLRCSRCRNVQYCSASCQRRSSDPMTTPFDPAAIYEVARQAKAAETIPALTEVLKANENLFADVEGQDEPLWTAADDSGLVETIMVRLSKPNHEFTSLGLFIVQGFNVLTPCLVAGGHSSLSEHQKQILFASMHIVFYASFNTASELRRSSRRDSSSILQMVQVSTVALAGQVFLAFGHDERLVGAADKGGLLRMVFDVLFGPSVPSNDPRRQRAIQDCTLAVTTTVFEAHLDYWLTTSCMRDAVSQYGSDRIAQECAALASSLDRKISIMGMSNIILFFHFRNYPGVLPAFIKHGVHSATVQGHWQRRKLKQAPFPEDCVDRFVLLSRILFDVHRHDGSRPNSLIVTAISQLMEEDDLLPLIANTILLFNSAGSQHIQHITKRLADMVGWIALTCKYNPALVERYCRAEWLRIMQGLLNLERCRPLKARAKSGGKNFAVDQWRQLGKLSKLDRKTAMTKSQANCSWIRCPLSTQDQPKMVRWDMLQCSGCRKVQYCTLSCQKRDWRSGHQAVCASFDNINKV